MNLTGVDYSQTAIDLAQSVAEEKKYSISFAVSGNCWPFQRLFVHGGGGVRRGMKCSREVVLQFSCLVEHLCQQFCVRPFVLKICCLLLIISLKTLARSINDKPNISATGFISD